MTGDYVVLSDISYCKDELEKGNYNAGIRFYFRYKDIIKHLGFIFDGYHPVKIKDEILLLDYLHSCIVPEQFKYELQEFIIPELIDKIHYLSQDNLKLSGWNDKVYNYINNL
jgi:hypothetical protein